MKTSWATVKRHAQEFANWLWGKFFPPVVKPWCAIFYFVSRSSGIDTVLREEGDLDEKLEDAVKAIKAAMKQVNRSQLHVVYRAVQNSGKLSAKVVRWPLSLPSSDYPNYIPLEGARLDLGTDLPHFLEWAYRWCPAKHYAIFFWGHSCGPAGLFEEGVGINVPAPLSLETLKAAFETFQKKRGEAMTQAEGAPVDRTGVLSHPDLTADARPGADAFDQLSTANPKVEIVLFQDCWMSTLETAYQLKHVVQYAIASQSLLPIGLVPRPPAPARLRRACRDFMWPYQKMLKHLSDPASDKLVLFHHVAEFYRTELAGIESDLTSVPLSLLDLSSVDGLTLRLGDLVESLDARGRDGRASTFALANIWAVDSAGRLTTGDAGLIDLVLLCKNLGEDEDSGVRVKADKLLAAITHVVRDSAESGPKVDALGKALGIVDRQECGYGGLSVLYYPQTADDFPGKPPLQHTYILDFVDTTFYDDLAFQKAFGKRNRRWPALENFGDPTNK